MTLNVEHFTRAGVLVQDIVPHLREVEKQNADMVSALKKQADIPNPNMEYSPSPINLQKPVAHANSDPLVDSERPPSYQSSPQLPKRAMSPEPILQQNAPQVQPLSSPPPQYHSGAPNASYPTSWSDSEFDPNQPPPFAGSKPLPTVGNQPQPTYPSMDSPSLPPRNTQSFDDDYSNIPLV